ncbi:MAG: molybdopterin molybdotransferase MoeA [Hyphomicrobiales bacterium]|nr:molybdopterin molybdotransferase MoeA [Hyphomicrobiales bacterium]
MNETPRDPLLPVAEALSRVVAGLEPTGSQEIPLGQASGRVLAQDLAATLTQPPFDASAMDGYAVRAADIGTLPCDLNVIGQAAAGHPFSGPVSAGEAVRIFTGAPVPDGADTIVIQEDTERNGDNVTVLEGANKGAFVRPKGFDFAKGDVAVRAGERLNARDITLAAAMNCAQVSVRRRPSVAILATGDELVPLGEKPGAGQIVSSIPHGLAAMIDAAGGEPILLGIARDTTESLGEHLERARDADIVLTIGGASVGDHDLVQDALKAQGMTLDFWKIAMRPGKPLMFGTLDAQRVIGVPGNPVSALVCTRIFLIPMLERLLGLAQSNTRETRVILAAPLAKNGPRQHYMRATLARDDAGRTLATPVRSQDSSLLSPLAQADCLLIRAPHAPAAAAGDAIPALLLDF